MRIESKYNPPEDYGELVPGHNYHLSAVAEIDDDATTDDCIHAFIRIMQTEGYTNTSLIPALIEAAADIAEDNGLDKIFEEEIRRVMEDWCF